MGRESYYILFFALLMEGATGCYSFPGTPEFVGEKNTDNEKRDSESEISTDKEKSTDTDIDTNSDTEKDSDSFDSELKDSDTLDTKPKTCADGLFCYSPPRECADSSNIKLFAPVGVCVEADNVASCYYEVLGTEPCEPGNCDSDLGFCVNDPCKGASCFNPSLRECTDNKTMQYWDATYLDSFQPGRCVPTDDSYQCEYSYSTYSCVQECKESYDSEIPDWCDQEDPLSRLSCALKPADYCEDDYLVQFSEGVGKLNPQGSGSCEFTEKNRTKCSGTCHLGKCTTE